MPGRPTLSYAEAGRIGARRRWGEQRVVRLDQLDPRVAAAVRALIAADEAVKARVAAGHPDAAQNGTEREGQSPRPVPAEVRRGDVENSAD